MKVILTKDIGKYKAGEVEVSEGRAKYFEKIGVIEHTPKKEVSAPAKASKPNISKSKKTTGKEKVKK